MGMERYYREADFSYTLGMSITIELLINHPNRVIKVYYSSKIYQNEFFDKLQALCNKKNIPLILDDHVIDSLSVKENCYVIAYFKKVKEKLALDSDHLVLCGIEDEGNLGTILRTAISFDLKDIVLVGMDIDYFEPKIVRASMGSIFFARIKSYPDLDTYLSEYKDHTPYMYADDGIDIHKLRPAKPYSIIINSPKELKDKITIQKKSDISLEIPLVCGIILATLYAKG